MLRTTLFYASGARRQREILSHEDSLVRCLTRTWPNLADVHDLRQVIYMSSPWRRPAIAVIPSVAMAW